MDASKYEIDDLDRQILALLQRDARLPFLEIARKLIVSGGTIHQRVEKMKAAGVIRGARIELDEERLGLGVTVLIGLRLNSAKKVKAVLSRLEAFPEVVEAFYTSGNYALILKVQTSDIKAYHRFLVEKLQSIEAIQFTESFICLDQPIRRQFPVTTP